MSANPSFFFFSSRRRHTRSLCDCSSDVCPSDLLARLQLHRTTFADGVEGLCHNSEASDSEGSPVKLEAGQEHDFKIIKMNQDEKKVGLSLRAVGAEASRADVEAYKHPASSVSATTTLGDIINWKRASNDQD